MRKNGAYITVILILIMAIGLLGSRNRRVPVEEMGKYQNESNETPVSGFSSPWNQLTEGILHFS